MTSTRPLSPNGTDACAAPAGRARVRMHTGHRGPHRGSDRRAGADKLRWEQRTDRAGKAAARRGLDAMLRQARGRGPSTLVSELLRMNLMIRLLGGGRRRRRRGRGAAAGVHRARRARRRPPRLGEAATLRAHRTAVFGHGENALADAATAFAVLTDITAPAAGEDPARWSRDLSRSLNGLVLVLLKLGSHELADEVSQRALAVSESTGSAMDRLVHQLNSVRLQLSWALRLERGGRDAAAATRFVEAAQTAHAAAQLWTTATGSGRPATEECSIIGAAFALQRPGPEHLDMLAGLRPHRPLRRGPHRAGHRHRALSPRGGPRRRRRRRARPAARGAVRRHHRRGRADPRAAPGGRPGGPPRRQRRPVRGATALRDRAGERAVGTARGTAHRAAQPLRPPSPHP